MIPTTAAKLIPVTDTDISPLDKVIAAPPSPRISIVDVIITFFILL